MVDETQQYSASEMERMMKVQDVLLKAMAKKITWLAAAEILGVTDRTMRRWRLGLEKFGYTGLADRRKGKPSAQRIPVATVEKVLGGLDGCGLRQSGEVRVLGRYARSGHRSLARRAQ